MAETVGCVAIGDVTIEVLATLFKPVAAATAGTVEMLGAATAAAVASVDAAAATAPATDAGLAGP